jgi:hypothetical protein
MAYVDKKAASISVTAGTTIQSSNLQSALEELDNEIVTASDRLDVVETDIATIETDLTTLQEQVDLLHVPDLPDIVTANLADKDLLVYNSTTSQFENTKALGAITVSELTLTDTAWDDLRFPSQAINPSGAPDAPNRSQTTGLLEFSGSTDNVIMGVAQMPHSWKEGTAISPHMHLRFPTSTATNTRWKFEYDMANPGADFVNAPGVFTDGGTITAANAQNTKRHAMFDFADITMTGKTLSCCILWKITRLANTDAADNYTGVTELLEFDIHYEIDKLGSDSEISNN